MLRSPLLTVVLIAGLVFAAVSSRRAAKHDDITAADRESCAYMAAETILTQRARGADWKSVASLTAIVDGCRSAAAAQGERWDLYWSSADAPLAVSIDSWDEQPPRGDEVAIGVTVINDTPDAQPADLRLLAVGPDGAASAASRLERLEVPAGSRAAASLAVRIPNDGPYQLAAELRPRNPELRTVWSRRKIGYPDPGAAVPDPPFENACCAAAGD